MTDSYRTISKKIGQGIYSEKRSKFLAFSHYVETEDEVKAIVADYRRKYYDARHVCYSYVLGADGATFRMNDDGEPSSTAGKPIYGQITKLNLKNILVIVVRYYGGVNLGTGPLAVAYKTAAAEALSNSEIEERIVEEIIEHTFTYTEMNAVMKVVKDTGARIVNQQFDNTCVIHLAIRKNEADALRTRLNNIVFG